MQAGAAIVGATSVIYSRDTHSPPPPSADPAMMGMGPHQGRVWLHLIQNPREALNMVRPLRERGEGGIYSGQPLLYAAPCLTISLLATDPSPSSPSY
jgi:hypothetical protein